MAQGLKEAEMGPFEGPNPSFTKPLFSAMNSLARLSPASDLSRLQRQFDTLLPGFFGSTHTQQDSGMSWTPRVDVHEDDNAYLLHMDVPGVQKENLQIDFHEGTLSISGERAVSERTENDTLVRVERHSGSFYRSFGLPKTVQADAIEARYDDGVLTVVVPKAEESRPRRIAVG